MSVKPIAVTIRVEGNPNLICLQNVRLYPNWARLACSQTIKLAADPNSERFPATVLTQAKISHAFLSSAEDIAAADAATLAPSNRTVKTGLRKVITIDVIKQPNFKTKDSHLGETLIA